MPLLPMCSKWFRWPPCIIQLLQCRITTGLLGMQQWAPYDTANATADFALRSFIHWVFWNMYFSMDVLWGGELFPDRVISRGRLLDRSPTYAVKVISNDERVSYAYYNAGSKQADYGHRCPFNNNNDITASDLWTGMNCCWNFAENNSKQSALRNEHFDESVQYVSVFDEANDCISIPLASAPTMKKKSLRVELSILRQGEATLSDEVVWLVQRW